MASILIERKNKNLVNWNILVARGNERNIDTISSGERKWKLKTKYKRPTGTPGFPQRT